MTWSNSLLSLAETLIAQVGILIFGFGIERLGNGDVPQKLHDMFLWPWRRSRAESMSVPNA